MSDEIKKFADLGTLQAFLDGCKTLFASIVHKHVLSDISDYTVDSELSSTSTNPVQNSVVNEAIYVLDQTINGKADSSHNHDSSDIISGTLSIDILPIVPTDKGGTGYTTIEDTIYTTVRYRASSLHSKKTTPTINGVIAWYYE